MALGVFYELRHTPAFFQARDLIQAGALGDIIAVRIQTLINKAATYWEVGYSGRSTNPWRGEKAHEKGLVQLVNYLDSQALTEGYLLIFDHSEVKKWHSEWIEVENKKIFSVWV